MPTETKPAEPIELATHVALARITLALERIAKVLDEGDGGIADSLGTLAGVFSENGVMHEALWKLADCVREDDAGRPVLAITGGLNTFEQNR